MKNYYLHLSSFVVLLLTHSVPLFAVGGADVTSLRESLKDICGFGPQDTIPPLLQAEIDKTVKCVSDLPNTGLPQQSTGVSVGESLASEEVVCSGSDKFRFRIDRIPSRSGIVIGVSGKADQLEIPEFIHSCVGSILGMGAWKVASKAVWIEPLTNYKIGKVAKIESLTDDDQNLIKKEGLDMDQITAGSKTGLVKNILIYHGKKDPGKDLLLEYFIQERYVSDLEDSTISSLDTLIHQGIQTIQGLEHIHNQGYIHRDIKPPNIVIGNDGSASIGDFGLAIRMADLRMADLQGTHGYMAPEIIGKRAKGSLPFVERQKMFGRVSPKTAAIRADSFALGLSLAFVAANRGFNQALLAAQIWQIKTQTEYTFLDYVDITEYYKRSYKPFIKSLYVKIILEIENIPSSKKEYLRVLAKMFNPNPSKRIDPKRALGELCKAFPDSCRVQ